MTARLGWQAFLSLSLLFGFGVLLRVAAIAYDWPFQFDPDEPTFVTRAASLLSRQTLDPGWYGHPGQLTMYLLAIAYSALIAGAAALGHLDGLSDAKAWFQTDPYPFYVVGRFTVAAFSICIPVLVGAILRHLTRNWSTVALGIVLTALSPLLVEWGATIRPDNQMTVFCLLSLLFAIRILHSPAVSNYLAAGAALGAAVSCKFPAVVFSLAILLGHTLRVRGRAGPPQIHLLMIAGTAAAIALILTAPYLLINIAGVIENLRTEARDYHLSATSVGPLSAASWYINNVLLKNGGIIGCGLSILGGVKIIASKDKASWLILGSASILFLLIINLKLQWTRWLIPLLPLYSL